MVTAADVVFEAGELLDISDGNVSASYFIGDGTLITEVNHLQDYRISSYGLVGYWSLDDLNDYSGNGHKGECSTCPDSTTGKSGSAYDFNGVDECIDVSDDSALDFTTQDMSLAAWIKVNNPDSAVLQRIIAKGRSGTDKGYEIIYQPSTDKIIFGDLDGSIYKTGFNLDDGDWHFVTATYESGNTYTLYVDGTEVQSPSSTGSLDGFDDTSAPFNIACRTYGSQLHLFNGSIDEVTVWNETLTTSEVAGLYELQKELISQKACLLGQGDHYEIGDTGLSYPLTINQSTSGISLWVSANVSAAGYTDRTPYWSGTAEEALNELILVDGINGEIDHTSLPDFTRTTYLAGYDTECTEVCEFLDEQEAEVCWDECTDTPVYADGRDIGATVTMLVEAVKALQAENVLLQQELCRQNENYAFC